MTRPSDAAIARAFWAARDLYGADDAIAFHELIIRARAIDAEAKDVAAVAGAAAISPDAQMHFYQAGFAAGLEAAGAVCDQSESSSAHECADLIRDLKGHVPAFAAMTIASAPTAVEGRS